MPTQPLSASEIQSRLTGRLREWAVRDRALEREFRTGAWQRTLLLANAIGFAAEAAGHHPDLLLSYPALKVRLVTHDAGGITEKDLALAERLEELATWQPAGESPLQGAGAAWF